MCFWTHHKTYTQTPHTHTTYHTAVSYHSTDAGLGAITAAAFRCKSAGYIPSPTRQQRVARDGSRQQRAVSITFSQQRLRLL